MRGNAGQVILFPQCPKIGVPSRAILVARVVVYATRHLHDKRFTPSHSKQAFIEVVAK